MFASPQERSHSDRGDVLRDRLADDPAQSAKSAGLRYVTDAKPGIRRLRRGKSFRYIDADGKPVHDRDVLARIRSLVIPPAWKDVWICPIPNGHLQATGRDARKRKQSRYHPRWREVHDETRYERMLLFGAVLPVIRKRIEQDLAYPGMPREKILATIIRLMETTFIRVGNEEYARDNHSYGLTTMRTKHVAVNGSTVHFEFPGKSGVKHLIDLTDRRLARIVKQCLDLPGYELFQYIDEADSRHNVGSEDVNQYLRDISGDHFTAKDFRTWSGSVLAYVQFQAFAPFSSETEAKKNIVAAVRYVSGQLGNTPAVCRKCYIHPTVFECYLSGRITQTLTPTEDGLLRDGIPVGLREEERDFLRLLRHSSPTKGHSD